MWPTDYPRESGRVPVIINDLSSPFAVDVTVTDRVLALEYRYIGKILNAFTVPACLPSGSCLNKFCVSIICSIQCKHIYEEWRHESLRAASTQPAPRGVHGKKKERNFIVTKSF